MTELIFIENLDSGWYELRKERGIGLGEYSVAIFLIRSPFRLNNDISRYPQVVSAHGSDRRTCPEIETDGPCWTTVRSNTDME